MTISAIVTTGVRSVGRLSLSGNRAREGYPPGRAELPHDDAHAPLALAGRGTGADDDGVAAGPQPAHRVQAHTDGIRGRAHARLREGAPAAHQGDANDRTALAAHTARDAAAALRAAHADR